MPATTIACPSCGTHLSVPTEAAGRTGRCPFCRGQFTVPTQPVAGTPPVDEDLITDWLSTEDEEEAQEAFGGRLGETLRDHSERQRSAADPAEPDADAAETTEPAPQPDSPPRIEAGPHESGPEFEADRDRPQPEAGEAAPPSSAEAAPPPSGPAPDAEQHDAPKERAADEGEHHHHGRSRKKHRYVVESAVRPLETDEREAEIQQRALFDQMMERRKSRDAASRHEPPAGDHARLSLLMANPDAVMLGFEARLLLRPAFRASMPIRCATCGETNREGMVARPLAFTDRGHGSPIAAGELETSYEVDVLATHTPRQIVDRMPVMDELVSPFNRAMPYYLCRRCAINGIVMCQAVDSPRGVLCEVTVADGPVALEWLGRVNGICGDEYAQLENEVHRFDADAWQALDEEVRRRLAAWFQPEDDEQFIGYFNDGDFARNDAGLAGVALTDRRMVFCKYHRHVKVRLTDSQITLLASRSGPFYDLTGKRGERIHKLIRLRPDELDALLTTLEQIDAPIQFQRDDG